ncbi:hypothetical protein ABVT39_007757 [Epinephelus coioides]
MPFFASCVNVHNLLRRRSGLGAASERSELLELPGPRVGAATGAAGIGLGAASQQAAGAARTPHVGHLDVRSSMPANTPLGYVVQR